MCIRDSYIFVTRMRPSPESQAYIMAKGKRTSEERVPMARILVVEDDEAIVDTLTSLLRSEGYETEQTGRQDAAVALLESTRFDLALVDVSLAQGDVYKRQRRGRLLG